MRTTRSIPPTFRSLVGLALACTFLPFIAAAQEPGNREGSVRREVRVDRLELDAYVTGSSGEPIPDLSPSDFVIRIDGVATPVEGAEWIPAAQSEGAVAG